MIKINTLAIPHIGDKVLLGMKKRGFGQGFFNGFGGKLHEGESIDEAMIRELREEAGILSKKHEKLGILEFVFIDGEIMIGHIYKIHDFDGEPEESEEMKPVWFDIKDLDFSKMWPDDIHWYDIFLRGDKFVGKFYFGHDKEVLEYKLEIVKDLE